jgi:hypothetical protein
VRRFFQKSATFFERTDLGAVALTPIRSGPAETGAGNSFTSGIGFAKVEAESNSLRFRDHVTARERANLDAGIDG